MGFHVAGYNDKTTNWPWFVNFLGGAVFYKNNWPPLPAKLIIDDTTYSITKGLPATFISPVGEWYQWRPSPRENKKVKILLSLSPENFPPVCCEFFAYFSFSPSSMQLNKNCRSNIQNKKSSFIRKYLFFFFVFSFYTFQYIIFQNC